MLRENAAETLQKDAESFIGERVRHFNVIFSVLVSFFSLKNISSGHSEMDRVAWFSREGMTLAIFKQPRPLNCALSVSLSYWPWTKD